MSVTTTNLVEGPGKLFSGAFGATEPLDTAVNATPQASAWTDVGGTTGGLTLEVNQTYTELEVDQIVDSVGRRLTKREITVSTSMAEPTLANLSMILNGGTSASGSGWASYDPLTTTSATQPNYVALIMDGWAPGGAFTRRAIIRKCLSTAKVDHLYAKDKQTVFAVSFNAHYVSSAITPIHWVDQTS
jgi:hypothetical protein